MDIKLIDLNETYDIGVNTPLKCFLHKATGEMQPFNQCLPAMIVVPGGGYHFCSEREMDPIALQFVTRHFNAFVLTYGVAPEHRHPTPITQLMCAVDYVKTHADELNIDKKRVFVVGFSAGGHLTGTLANFHGDSLKLTGKKLDCRPTAVIMSYPVVHNHSHEGSFKNLLGVECVDCAEAEALSLEKTVTASNPPTFIWTTAEDTCVDPMATVLYTAELIKNHVMVESHIFPKGWHGSATCDANTNRADAVEVFEKAKAWVDLATDFVLSVPELKE